VTQVMHRGRTGVSSPALPGRQRQLAGSANWFMGDPADRCRPATTDIGSQPPVSHEDDPISADQPRPARTASRRVAGETGVTPRCLMTAAA
jgi:hypothetical protein